MAEHFELIVFGLLVAVAGLVLLSDTVTDAAASLPATPALPTNGRGLCRGSRCR